MRRPSRRDLLRGTVVGGTGVLAGCPIRFDEEPECTHDDPGLGVADGVAPDGWPMAWNEPGSTGVTSTTAASDLDAAAVAWSTNLPGRPTGPPLVAGGTVCVDTAEEVVAVDAATGQERWRVVTDATDATDSVGYAIDGQRAYVAQVWTGDDDTHSLSAFNLSSGSRRWERTMEHFPDEVAVTDDAVLAGTVGFSGRSGGTLHSVAPDDGTERWQTALPGDVRTRPVVTTDLVLVGTQWAVVGLDRATGGECVRDDRSDHPWRLAARNGKLYLAVAIPGEGSISLQVWDGLDTDPVWTTGTVGTEPVREVLQIAVADGTILLATPTEIHALDGDGQTAWRWERPRMEQEGWRPDVLLVAGGVVLTDGPSELYAVDLASGRTRGSISLNTRVRNVTAAEDALFAVSGGENAEPQVHRIG